MQSFEEKQLHFYPSVSKYTGIQSRLCTRKQTLSCNFVHCSRILSIVQELRSIFSLEIQAPVKAHALFSTRHTKTYICLSSSACVRVFVCLLIFEGIVVLFYFCKDISDDNQSLQIIVQKSTDPTVIFGLKTSWHSRLC